MKTLLLFVVACLVGLSGCSTNRVALDAAPARQSVTIVATLATNACEADTAPDYTAVIVARRRATVLLRERRISVELAEQVQHLADLARAALDRACLGGKPDPEAIQVARSARARLTELLETSHAR